MSENAPIFIALAILVAVVLTVTDFKIASAIEKAKPTPTKAELPIVLPSAKCDTIIRSGDTVFIYIKNK